MEHRSPIASIFWLRTNVPEKAPSSDCTQILPRTQARTPRMEGSQSYISRLVKPKSVLGVGADPIEDVRHAGELDVAPLRAAFPVRPRQNPDMEGRGAILRRAVDRPSRVPLARAGSLFARGNSHESLKMKKKETMLTILLFEQRWDKCAHFVSGMGVHPCPSLHQHVGCTGFFLHFAPSHERAFPGGWREAIGTGKSHVLHRLALLDVAVQLEDHEVVWQRLHLEFWVYDCLADKGLLHVTGGFHFRSNVSASVHQQLLRVDLQRRDGISGCYRSCPDLRVFQRVSPVNSGDLGLTWQWAAVRTVRLLTRVPPHQDLPLVSRVWIKEGNSCGWASRPRITRNSRAASEPARKVAKKKRRFMIVWFCSRPEIFICQICAGRSKYSSSNIKE